MREQPVHAAIGQSAMRKSMLRILPLAMLSYVMAYMDRVNVSFAALRMNDDLHFSATIYGLGGGLFFLGYALFEVPSSLMLRRFRAPQWLARIMITWGFLSAGMVLVRTPTQFYAMRFLLGVAEAGFFPSLVFYFSHWFPTTWRGRAISRIYIAAPLASIVMGAISGFLLGLNGTLGLRGWQWLFLVQGLPSVLVGIVIGVFLPEGPEDVAWLTHQERQWISDRLRHDQALIGEPVRHGLLSALRNPFVLLLGIAGLLMNGAGNGLLLTAPAVLTAATGLSAQYVGYIISIGGLVTVLCLLATGSNSDRHGDRLKDAMYGELLVGVALLLTAVGATPGWVIAGYLAFVAAFECSASILVASWADVLHVRELAVGGAAINTLWQLGSFLSPYGFGILRDATGGFKASLILSSLIAFLLAGMLVYLRHRVSSRRAS